MFVYDAVLEAIMQGNTVIPASRFSSTFRRLQKSGRLQEQFDILSQFEPKMKGGEGKIGLLQENLSKNRDMDKVTGREIDI